MEKKSYSELLKDPRWQKRRLEIMQRDNFTCKDCGATDKTLHVHHKYYIYKKLPWEYDDELLITLCIDCHEEWEELDFIIKVSQKTCLYLDGLQRCCMIYSAHAQILPK